MSTPWFVTAGGRQHGPFTAEQLVALARQQRIGPTDLVRKGDGPWTPAADVPGLFRTAASVADVPPTVTASAVHRPDGAEPTLIAQAVDVAPHSHGYAAAVGQSAASHGSHPPRRSPGNERLLVTAASILVGAAAAIVIYINLEGLENRIFHRQPADDELPATESIAPVAPVAPPAPANDAAKESASPLTAPAAATVEPMTPPIAVAAIPAQPVVVAEAPASVVAPVLAPVVPRATSSPTAAAIATAGPSPIATNSPLGSASIDSKSTAPANASPTSASPAAMNTAPTNSVSVAPSGRPAEATPANPPPTSVGPEPGAFQPQQWLARMRDLDARKEKLLADRDTVLKDYQPLADEAESIRADLRKLSSQAARVKRSYSSTVKSLEDLLQLRDVGQKVSSSAISSLQSQASQLQSDFRTIESEAAPRERRLTELSGPIGKLTEQLDRLYVDAERLRRDLFDHVQPFGPASPERGEAALHYFAGLSSSGSQAGYAKFGAGCAHLAKGDFPTALSSLDDAVGSQPKDPMFLAVRGLAKVRNGDDPGGRKDLAEALKADPKCYLARYLFSIALLRNGGYPAAESQLREAMKVDPANPDGLRLMALLKCACDDDKIRKSDFGLKNAQQAFDAAASPANTLALAIALADNGKFDEAASHAERAVAVADAARASWYRECLKTFQAKQPLRLNLREFDYLAKL